jgi:membrane protein implicated in regulation of membrane protease activity
VAFLLVLALIVIAIAAVLLPDKVNVMGAVMVVFLLAALAAAILGIPWYGRRYRVKVQATRLDEK